MVRLVSVHGIVHETAGTVDGTRHVSEKYMPMLVSSNSTPLPCIVGYGWQSYFRLPAPLLLLLLLGVVLVQQVQATTGGAGLERNGVSAARVWAVSSPLLLCSQPRRGVHAAAASCMPLGL